MRSSKVVEIRLRIVCEGLAAVERMEGLGLVADGESKHLRGVVDALVWVLGKEPPGRGEGR